MSCIWGHMKASGTEQQGTWEGKGEVGDGHRFEIMLGLAGCGKEREN